jgi:hypothetical protein
MQANLPAKRKQPPNMEVVFFIDGVGVAITLGILQIEPGRVL